MRGRKKNKGWIKDFFLNCELMDACEVKRQQNRVKPNKRGKKKWMQICNQILLKRFSIMKMDLLVILVFFLILLEHACLRHCYYYYYTGESCIFHLWPAALKCF